MNNIICLLSVRPSIKCYNFFKEIKQNTKYNLYIFIDDNNYNLPINDNIIKIIKINNEECEKNGYKSCILWLDNKACSRDKALYYFNKENISYDYIWFVEEDVFIPDIKTIENIDLKYSDEDLLVKSNNILYSKENIWNCEHVNKQIKINYPFGCSLICAIRCSKKMLECINNYAKTYNNLFLDESLFNTLAIHNNLKINCISELDTIHWRKKWYVNDINKNNLYHPIKDINIQYKLREYLNKNNKSYDNIEINKPSTNIKINKPSTNTEINKPSTNNIFYTPLKQHLKWDNFMLLKKRN